MSEASMHKNKTWRWFGGVALFAAMAGAQALDFPHSPAVNNISCLSCHDMSSFYAKMLRVENPHPPQDIDDTIFNNLCWSCHNDVVAPHMKTHSSATTDDGYGNWSIECRTCHGPHNQLQTSNGTGSYLVTGTITAVTATTLTSAGAGWTDNAYAGLTVFPNITNRYSYRILSNTSDTLTLEGPVSLVWATPGSTFAVIYGKLIKNEIQTPNSGLKPVRFFRTTGTNSYADGDATYDGICEVCHTQTRHHRNNNDDPTADHTHNVGIKCTVCHDHKNGFTGMGRGAHAVHVRDDYGPKISCGEGGWGCHGTYTPGDYPVVLFADGCPLVDDPSATEGCVTATTVCTSCHGEGAVSAKAYFSKPGSSGGESAIMVTDTPYTWNDTWMGQLGETAYCGSCHNETANSYANMGGTGDVAPNVAGDSVSYGFSINGHGKASGNYAALSWQESTATGNPAAGLKCSDCHDLGKPHFNNANPNDKRLKAGYENDVNNTVCVQCHGPGKQADANPRWFTDYAAYNVSAHGADDKGDLKCTDCHDPHGVADPRQPLAGAASVAMTRGNKQELCFRCHSDTGDLMQVKNDAISGAALADDIKQAVNLGVKHDMGHDFTLNGKNYKLQCISCHNVHLVTGKYWEANQGKSPVTRFPATTTVWGDGASEKMADYGGTYATPNGDTFTGTQLPNYPDFCLDCHATMTESGGHGGINWSGDPHGLQSANQPNGYGTCPNWFACGNAESWDGDLCAAANPDDCWPVMTRGKGDELYSRSPYNHEERIAGANFAMSCTDCHEVHGSGIGSMLRTNPNGGTGTTTWNTMCNNCHYYYSDWHAGMSCGSASCHVTTSIHRMSNNTGSGGTRTFNPDLVLHLAFENNLKDSGSWQMDSKWMDDIAGSFGAGKTGQAITLNGGNNVQVGTENAYWSTDEGYHGTWKYTEMKFNTTLEAWVKPTDNARSEYSIFTKHVGYNNGGYAFTLQKLNGGLRAVLNIQADNNGTAQNGKAGIRGAYSSVVVPLNAWTHVAASFDTAGPDRNPADPAVGRIRIYINGEDVTASDPSGNYMQPVAGETSIFAYPENSGWNEGPAGCYNGTWCAGEFSVGGFYGWQNSFIGGIDEAKVWNTTKGPAYFATYDAMAGPYISTVEGVIGTNTLAVTFSEGVYTSMGSSGALTPSDFVLTDTDNGRTIVGVNHVAGSRTAVLTLSSVVDGSNDMLVDTLAVAASAIYDDKNLAASTAAVTLSPSSTCPSGTVTFNLNEASGSSYVLDTQSMLTGEVFGGAATLSGSAYSGGGDGSGRYIMFNNNATCLQATTAMTIEARIKPTGMAGTGNYVRRILARDGSANYQLSLWRNNTTYPGLFTAPSGEVSIALWVNPADVHGGNAWKPVLTNYTGAANGGESSCAIVSDRWYKVKAIWNTAKPGGTPGQFFVPADIYVDDQGTNGNDVGEAWAGYRNCTDADQSLKTDVVKLYTADSIKTGSGTFAIGTNRSTPTSNLFNGLIDWLVWKDAADPAP